MPLLIGVGPTNANIVQINSLAVGSSEMTTNQVQISSTTSTLIVAANSNRRFLAILNNSGQSIYLGSSTSVTESNGFELPTGATLNITRQLEQYTGPIYAIAPSSASSLPTISYMEI